MGVRQCLNENELFGAVFWSAILGVGCNSCVAAGILVGLGLIDGSVRLAAVRPHLLMRRRSAVRRHRGQQPALRSGSGWTSIPTARHARGSSPGSGAS